jgi:hypothetical protein
MTSDKNGKKARRLLGLYWLYKVAGGSSVPKATLKTLAIEAASMKQEYRNRHANGQTVKRAAVLSKPDNKASGGRTGAGKRKGAAMGWLIMAILKKARTI